MVEQKTTSVLVIYNNHGTQPRIIIRFLLGVSCDLEGTDEDLVSSIWDSCPIGKCGSYGLFEGHGHVAQSISLAKG